jgi:hypothetical protein
MLDSDSSEGKCFFHSNLIEKYFERILDPNDSDPQEIFVVQWFVHFSVFCSWILIHISRDPDPAKRLDYFVFGSASLHRDRPGDVISVYHRLYVCAVS